MTQSIHHIVFRPPTPVEREQLARPLSSIADAYTAIRLLMVGWLVDDPDQPYAPAMLENVVSEADASRLAAALVERVATMDPEYRRDFTIHPKDDDHE